jgi:hypothetical protein
MQSGRYFCSILIKIGGHQKVLVTHTNIKFVKIQVGIFELLHAISRRDGTILMGALQVCERF